MNALANIAKNITSDDLTFRRLVLSALTSLDNRISAIEVEREITSTEVKSLKEAVQEIARTLENK